jgi:hypothetical protein
MIERIAEGSIDVPAFPLDSVIDLMPALANKAKEEIFLLKTKKESLYGSI